MRPLIHSHSRRGLGQTIAEGHMAKTSFVPDTDDGGPLASLRKATVSVTRTATRMMG